MAVDWGEALVAGVGGAAGAWQGQLQQDQEEQKWQERQQQMQALNQQNERERQRYLASLKPPETRKVNIAGDGGKPMVQQQEWKLTGDQGAWQNVGDATPDINFERLDETQRHNQETEQMRAAADQARAEANAARVDVARERLAAQQEKRNGTETQPKPYTFTDEKTGQPIVRYGSFINGQFQPAMDERGKPIQGDKFRPSVFQEKRSAQAEGVKGTLRQLASGLGLDAMADAVSGYGPSSSGSAPPPAAQAAPTKAPYPDGTKLKGPDGRTYIVRNGQPVPM